MLFYFYRSPFAFGFAAGVIGDFALPRRESGYLTPTRPRKCKQGNDSPRPGG
jgi:hypothetical protein